MEKWSLQHGRRGATRPLFSRRACREAQTSLYGGASSFRLRASRLARCSLPRGRYCPPRHTQDLSTGFVSNHRLPASAGTGSQPARLKRPRSAFACHPGLPAAAGAQQRSRLSASSSPRWFGAFQSRRHRRGDRRGGGASSPPRVCGLTRSMWCPPLVSLKDLSCKTQPLERPGLILFAWEQVLQWYVSEGDHVDEFDRVCEVQSDKATVLPLPALRLTAQQETRCCGPAPCYGTCFSLDSEVPESIWAQLP